jgi:serine/threonine protein phosphatase PrpC
MGSRGGTFPLWHSAQLSIPAAHRAASEDALLDLPELGVWAVADGLGGHSMGRTASRAVVDALAQALTLSPGAPPFSDLAERIAVAEAALHDANRHLLALGRSQSPPTIMGSTVVVVLATPDRAAILWVGDSRLYIMRDRALHQITQDHAREIEWVDAADRDAPPRLRQVLTQAIGSTDRLQVASCDIRLASADRLLLCTDGLYKAIDSLAIACHLLEPVSVMAAAVSGQLQHAAVTDDVTIVAIERAHAEPS